MIVLFWIFVALASIFTIAFVVGICTRKFIFSACMNIGLAVCSFIINLINLAIKYGD